MAAQEGGYASPYWMTYTQTTERGAQVRKGERTSLVVYAGAIERTAQTDNGEEVERRIPFMKGYNVFNTDQIDGLPAHYCVRPAPQGEPSARIAHADAFFANLGADIREGGNSAFYRIDQDLSSSHPSRPSFRPRPTRARWRMNASTGRATPAALTATLAASNGAAKAMPWRKSWPNSGACSWPPTSALPPNPATTTPPISPCG